MLDTKNPLATIIVGSGFLVTINSGTIILSGVPTTIPQTVINLTSNATNFIHITSGGVLTVNTTGFPSDCLPVSKVVCSPTAITGITDSRPDFILPSAGISPPSFQLWGGRTSGFPDTALTAANKIRLCGFWLPYSVTFSTINVDVNTVGGPNVIDLGIYDTSGTLRAHIGAQPFTNTGQTNYTFLNAPISLPAARYYLAFTSNGTSPLLCIAGGTTQDQFVTFAGLQELPSNSSSGGNLPNSITPPVDNYVGTRNVYGATLF